MITIAKWICLLNEEPRDERLCEMYRKFFNKPREEIINISKNGEIMQLKMIRPGLGINKKDVV